MTESPRNWRRLIPIAALTLAAVAAVAFAFGMASRPTSALAADPSASPSAASGTWTGPHGFRGMHMDAFGDITIKAIDGTKLSLQTADGWTRTIDASGATVTKGGQTISIGDLKVGDQITFRETRQSDGSYKITAIDVVLPHVAGTVASKTSNSIVVTTVDGKTVTVKVSSSTKYFVPGQTNPTLANVAVGDRIVAEGTLNSDGSLTATAVTAGPVKSGFGGMRGHMGGFGGGPMMPGTPGTTNPQPSAPSA